MKERPIIFNPPLVAAILEGRKTQTRRLAKGDKCPFGNIGDKLWVRESFYDDYERVSPDLNLIRYMNSPPPEEKVHRYKKKPAIHMPRWASRLTLDIVGIRKEKLHKITEHDMLAEGFSCKADFNAFFAALYGIEILLYNPEVWVITFKISS